MNPLAPLYGVEIDWKYYVMRYFSQPKPANMWMSGTGCPLATIPTRLTADSKRAKSREGHLTT